MSILGGVQAAVAGDSEFRWAVCVPSAQSAAIGHLRLTPGIEAHTSHSLVWLRGRHLENGLDRRLRALPGARRFRVLEDGQLLAAGQRVPKGRIPEGPWTPLADWMSIEPPRACGAARLGLPMAMVLRRSSNVVEPSVLLTSPNGWGVCAEECPQVRLDRWRFAVSGNGFVAIVGRPLPSLPGQQLVDYGGIAVPAGWYWSPPVEPAVLRERFRLQRNDLVLWRADGVLERIADEHFVRATRASIRASVEELRHGRP